MLHNTRKSAWRRSALLIVAAVLVMTVMAACGNKNDNETSGGKDKGAAEFGTVFAGAGTGTEIATFKDGNVTEPEFDKYLGVFTIMQPGYEQVLAIPQFKEQLLQQFVSYKILAGQASEETKKKASEETEKQIADFEAAVEAQPELKTTLTTKNVTTDDVRTYLSLMLAVVEHMNSQVKDDEIKAEYEANSGLYTPITVRHILVATTDQATNEELRTMDEALKIAKEVKVKLDAGGDWAALAKEYSDDPGTKEKGGLYADVKPSGWVEGFKNAAIKQEVGKIGEPVETEYGYHVILVEKRDIKAFADIDDATQEEVKNAVAYTHMNKFMTDEMPKQEVKITLPEATEAPAESPAAEASPAPTAETKK
ncbi:MAG: peptidylprolyl isomerase [Candidatus Pristimantibacillus sp.]